MGVQTAGGRDGNLVGCSGIVHRHGVDPGAAGRRALESLPRPCGRRVPAVPRRQGRARDSGSSQGVFSGDTTLVGSYSQATLFTHAGLGFDYFPARSFAIGVNGGYDWMANFARPVGSQRNLSGPEVNFNFGFLFGHGRPPAP